jgi:hypothetical protein
MAKITQASKERISHLQVYKKEMECQTRTKVTFATLCRRKEHLSKDCPNGKNIKINISIHNELLDEFATYSSTKVIWVPMY